MEFDLFARELKGLGAGRAFGIPGGGPSLKLVDALEQQGIPFITTGYETTGALMAAASTRFGNNPSLCLSIKGPGFANMAPGLLSNAYEGFAHLSISEAYPQAMGPRRHKWLNHFHMGGEYLKSISGLSGSEGFATSTWEMARSEYPGPALIELAQQESPQPRTSSSHATLNDPVPLMKVIEASQRPVLILGGSCQRFSATTVSMLETLNFPVFTTPCAKGVVNESLPHAAGIYTGDGSERTPEAKLLPLADLVITLCVRSGEVLNPKAPGDNCLCLDLHRPADWRCFPPDDFGEVTEMQEEEIASILDDLSPRSWGQDEIQVALRLMDQDLLQHEGTPWQAFAMVQEALPDAIHAVDTGNFTVMAEHALQLSKPTDWIATPNGRYMGMGVGYALGAAASSDRPVVLWIGDGGLRAFFSELALAVENQWNLLVLVMKDGHFGSILGRAQAMNWTGKPLVMRDRSFARVAETMGFRGEVVRAPEELHAGLTSWAKSRGPALFEVELKSESYIEATALLR